MAVRSAGIPTGRGDPTPTAAPLVMEVRVDGRREADEDAVDDDGVSDDGADDEGRRMLR